MLTAELVCFGVLGELVVCRDLGAAASAALLALQCRHATFSV